MSKNKMILKTAFWTIVLTTAIANDLIEPMSKVETTSSATLPTEKITKSPGSHPGQKLNHKAVEGSNEKIIDQANSEQNEDTNDKTKNDDLYDDHSGDTVNGDNGIETTEVTPVDTTSKLINEATPSQIVSQTSVNKNRAAKISISVVLTAAVLMTLVASRKYKKRQSRYLVSMENLALTETTTDEETI